MELSALGFCGIALKYWGHRSLQKSTRGLCFCHIWHLSSPSHLNKNRKSVWHDRVRIIFWTDSALTSDICSRTVILCRVTTALVAHKTSGSVFLCHKEQHHHHLLFDLHLQHLRRVKTLVMMSSRNKISVKYWLSLKHNVLAVTFPKFWWTELILQV